MPERLSSWYREALFYVQRYKVKIAPCFGWKKVRKTLLIIFAIITLVILMSFVFRNLLFNYYLNQYVSRFNTSYHAELKIEKAALRGMRSVEVQGIMLKPVLGDTLLTIDSIYATLSFWKALTGRIALNNFKLSDMDLTFIKKDSLTNYMFLFDKKTSSKQDPEKQATKNYAARMKSILGTLFDKVPDDLSIRDFNIRSDYNGHELHFKADTFSINDHRFRTILHLMENQKEWQWITQGSIDKYDHIVNINLFSADHQKVVLPFLKYKWNAEIGFDTLNFEIGEKYSSSSRVDLKGRAALKGLEVGHPRIATEKINFGKGQVDFTLGIGNNYYEIDSSTHVVFNELSFNPYLKYQAIPEKHLTLIINKNDFPADELFSSLPSGLFQNLEGIKTSGNLNFHLLFDVALSHPDSLVFNCELTRTNFRILSYGKTNFTFINEPFEYTAYEKGEAVRTFMVGPENPNFRTLDQISPFLRNSVLNSEDGAFFSHRGFLPEAFRESIVTNIKERRFARGGSTITMQLVKNVFLNRNKTIARKLEEVLIVWMIENLQLSSKERMFEIYLNVIEWGPLIYGAQEASRFYFNKDVSKLTYAEALYLATIIPRPKYFRYVFDKNTGGLRDYVINYYQRMAEKMLKKGMISQEDYDQLKPSVTITGPAKVLLQEPDSLHQADSLMLLREEFIK
jgi:hypothetical protein